ncbi:TPA: 50S ribosomal protein L24 [Candidatus Campbellbacteria bacterium]|uniref:Large ribosomal subunit protein uL24 n=2 Tax=Candidatus Campbelliibacteriota TaxID=1752727 RepID=A0A1F5EPX5_9BACT|nr:MAG: 50S ribosomal protein L24, large subunit ribosomal protein L24 [Candidatus Campbellbacteria bacterium GW2011_OD1_34_28]KKP75159.1 MAG: 50S ribosomal protein L24 [Candidatus Campbellbacteria bacterium GW2011_GWD2_35_24]KKP76280.1 MAG: 50S ribosomal protein L24, large subunit ribosomal protein L24 [Candidatus Campbellbacteria bacterium GW2011_GWC2_35_28]KKP77469.1 MAG: 50S ribosomal protein L24 [Candidatus Campbellbacteria bacterium GW2011_GWC1_35_31]KKP79398.1 MAG: 50S ribosomal protein 
MKIRKDDKVIVIAGKDKGKTGKVLKAIPAEDKVVVEGVNLKKKHQKANKSGKKGQIIDKIFPIHVSNVMLADPKSDKPTRIGKKLVGDKFVRIAKKSGTTLK